MRADNMTKQNDDKRYYQKHKEQIKEHVSQEYYKNIDKSHMHNHLRYIRERTKDIAILHNLKINGCAICGYDKCDWALDFHHVNPEDKKFKIDMRSMRNNVKRIADELNKCVLICSNCHRELHHKENRNKNKGEMRKMKMNKLNKEGDVLSPN